MKALTVQQPWGTAIIHWGKSPENRTRNIAGGHRGTIAIHAGKQLDEGGLTSPLIGPPGQTFHSRHHDGREKFWRLTSDGQKWATLLDLGAVIGVADLVGVHEERLGCCRPWGERSHDGRRIVHLELENPRPLAEPVPCRGALGLWTLPADVLDQVLEQLDPRLPAAVPGGTDPTRKA